MQRNRVFVGTKVGEWVGSRSIIRASETTIVAKNAMVAWYPFQDSANDQAIVSGFGDNTAYNLSTTNVSYVTDGFAPGIKSLSITESPASVVQNTSMPWSGNPQFSVSMWIKRKSTVKDGLWGIGGGASAGQGINSYGLAFSSPNEIGWDLWAAQRFSTNQTYPLDSWIHVVWIKFGAMNETGLKCVINGIEYSVVPEGGSPTVTPSLINGFSIGDISANESRPVTAMEVYDVRVFNRALTTTEAQQVYASTLLLLPGAVTMEYLVIAGGGGGGGALRGGGGGAGGYLSSVVGESSGGGASAEAVFAAIPNQNYTVTVGAGGASGFYTTSSVDANGGSSGANSSLSNITAIGGGGGAGSDGYGVGKDPKVGGSGGGGWYGDSGPKPGAAGTAGQGFAGGNGGNSPPYGGGGGGAGQAGFAFNAAGTPMKGGDGVQSSITGSAIYRAGGGSSSNFTVNSNAAGGLGGGGIGRNGTGVTVGIDPSNGATNTGSGGGASGNGGSGIVILRYPSTNTLTIGAGLTASTEIIGNNKVTSFTAGTGTISIS